MKTQSFMIAAAAVVVSAQKQAFQPKAGNFPENGDDTIAGGIFSISLPNLAIWLMRNGGLGSGKESPSPGPASTGGSGKYPAHMFTDPSLPEHTLYAPKNPPPVPMPFITWGNGGCGFNGAGYERLLTEIASHGYIVAADGPLVKSGNLPSLDAKGAKSKGSDLQNLFGNGLQGSARQSKWSDMKASLDWALAGKAAKYGNIDLEKIAATGHSCGGLEAMSIAYKNPKVKLNILFNIAIFQDDRRYLLKELKSPVAWLIGGPQDMGFVSSNKDYDLLPEGLPAFKANLDTGHMATFNAKDAGKYGKAAVAILESFFRNDAAAKAVLLDPKSPGSLVSENWNVTHKNWK